MHIVFVGLPGVPYRGRACDTRLTYFANLFAKDNDVTIVNWFSPESLNKQGRGELNDKVSIIDVLKTRKSTGLSYYFFYVLSFLKEPFVLLNLHRKQKIDVLHIYTEKVLVYIIYWIISIIIGSKLVYSYVEDRSSFKSNFKINSLLQKIAENVAAKLCDGVLPISHYLESKALGINPKLNSLRIPPICDFETFAALPVQTSIPNKYLLYCGSIGYKEIVDIIYKAYKDSSISSSRGLVLVLSGNKTLLERASEDYPDATIMSHLDYRYMISCFKGAECLLIPLRNITSEVARFPNKICEYLASNGVLVTTNVGEIPYFFTDGKNAIIADNCDSISLASVFDKIATKEYDIDYIKRQSYATGLKYFDLHTYTASVSTFLQNL